VVCALRSDTFARKARLTEGAERAGFFETGAGCGSCNQMRLAALQAVALTDSPKEISMLARILATLAIAAITTPTGAFAAQDYPTRPITLIVPFAAGGPTDTLARNLAQGMAQTLKYKVVVENKVGAGGTIGANFVARAKADGYTVLLAHIGMSTAPALYRKLPYNPLSDFEYIGQVADVPMTMLGAKKLPADNFKDFLAYIKANKDKLTYGNAGLGAASHLCGLLFMNAISTDFQTVSYKGTAPAMSDLMGGQIDFMCDQTTNTTGQIQAGTVKVYGVTSRKRVPSLPKIPTLEEQGLKGFEVVVWHGVYAPKGTPKAALDKLNAALKTAVQDAAFKQAMVKLGAEPVPPEKVTPESLRSLLKSEIDKWGPIIKKAGVYAD
jgi:tripartite-type tricarboxylate transporter receptor subunit TctC